VISTLRIPTIGRIGTALAALVLALAAPVAWAQGAANAVESINFSQVQGGKIVATGPGLPMPSPDSMSDEPWNAAERQTRFVPMQAKTGDYALFFRKAAVEITFEGDRYLVVPQAAILALVREE